MEAWASQQKARTLADRKMFDLPLHTFPGSAFVMSLQACCVSAIVYMKKQRKPLRLNRGATLFSGLTLVARLHWRGLEHVRSWRSTS